MPFPSFHPFDPGCACDECRRARRRDAGIEPGNVTAPGRPVLCVCKRCKARAPAGVPKQDHDFAYGPLLAACPDCGGLGEIPLLVSTRRCTACCGSGLAATASGVYVRCPP